VRRILTTANKCRTCQIFQVCVIANYYCPVSSLVPAALSSPSQQVPFVVFVPVLVSGEKRGGKMKIKNLFLLLENSRSPDGDPEMRDDFRPGIWKFGIQKIWRFKV
jgi:hypothetical protein